MRLRKPGRRMVHPALRRPWRNRSPTTTARRVRIKQRARCSIPKTSALTGPVSVLVNGKVIAAVESAGQPPHARRGDHRRRRRDPGRRHSTRCTPTCQQDGALLNLIAGITTVRDMGNDNAVLGRHLIQRMDSGEIGGPHVIRSGFIEGKSPYSAPTTASSSTARRRPSTRCAGTARATTGRSRSTTA